MLIQFANIGRGEVRGFDGSATVAWVQKINEHYYPRTKTARRIRAGRALPTLRAAKAWVVMMRKHESKKGEMSK